MSILTSRKAGNWVDRGEAPEPTLRRILAFYFGRHDPADGPWLGDHAAAIRGMVEADATEVHIASYLYGVLRETGAPAPPGGRITAIALWHVAKAALVRDFAERVLRGEIPRPDPTPEPLSRWLAARLLTAAELEEFERGDGPPPYAEGRDDV